eukprot:6193270-Pleurochrysis_carterae.AAC.1
MRSKSSETTSTEQRAPLSPILNAANKSSSAAHQWTMQLALHDAVGVARHRQSSYRRPCRRVRPVCAASIMFPAFGTPSVTLRQIPRFCGSFA